MKMDLQEWSVYVEHDYRSLEALPQKDEVIGTNNSKILIF